MFEITEITSSWRGHILAEGKQMGFMLLVGEGNVELTIGTDLWAVKKRSIFFCENSASVELASGRIASGYLVCFLRPLFDAFLVRYPRFQPFVGDLCTTDFTDVAEQRFALLLEEVALLRRSLEKSIGLEIRKQLFFLLLLSVFDDRQFDNSPSVEDKLLAEFTVLLEAHFRKQRSTSFYARRVAVSSRRLNHLCRGWFAGRDVFEVLMDRICSEAEFMLLSSDVPVKAVAYDLGFSSTHHFRVYLKRYRGVTPTRVRERGKQE